MAHSDARALIGAGLSSARILVVDDEPDLLRATARILQSIGYQVTTAADGREAYDLVCRSPIDVIVSDISMPDLDGILLLKLVRQRDLDIPVILMTGSPGLKTAIDAVAHGAFHYLVKPVLARELEDVTRRAVRIRHIARIKREALELVNDGGLGIADRIGLEASFDRALESLYMVYQPIVHATSGSPFGYETLLRTEEKSLPHPGTVIAAAERLQRLGDLGRKIRSTCANAIRNTADDAALFLNLHPRDLIDEELFSTVSPLATIASRVVLEITERASLDDVPDVRPRIESLRRMGFRIAIDDLGAGYAGLTSFVLLEPEIAKIDMSLVRGVEKSATKQKLIRSIVTLCKDLGILTVAEGVETVEERDCVSSLGCELLQGYLLGKPDRALRMR